jgi:hypothetical protein
MLELRNPILIVILTSSIVIGSSHLTRGHEWGDDFASYVMQAKSIWNGDMQDFIEHNSITIYRSSSQIGPVAYPWGYPLILTPVYAVKGISPLGFKLPGLFFFSGFLICLYLLMRTHLRRTESLLLVSLFAFNPLLLDFLDQILSDVPFLFFSTLALLWMVNENKHGTIHYALLGVVMAFAFFVRTTGILLLISFLAIEILRIWNAPTTRESNTGVLKNIVVVLTTFGALWAAYSLIFPGGSESYFDQLGRFKFEAVLPSFLAYLQLFSLFLGTSLIWKYLYYLLLIFFLIGVWVCRKKNIIFIIFFILWMTLLIIWPVWQGPRFIFPLLPIFIYFAFQGMKSVINNLPDKYHQIGERTVQMFWFLIAVIFLLNSTIRASANLRNNRSINGPFDPYSLEVYTFINEKTPANSLIIFFKPRALRLMTDHDAISITECDRIPLGDYLVLSRKVGENLQIPPEEIETCSLPLDEVYRNRRFIIYEILK